MKGQWYVCVLAFSLYPSLFTLTLYTLPFTLSSSNPAASSSAVVPARTSSNLLLRATVIAANKSFCRSSTARNRTNSSTARNRAINACRQRKSPIKSVEGNRPRARAQHLLDVVKHLRHANFFPPDLRAAAASWRVPGFHGTQKSGQIRTRPTRVRPQPRQIRQSLAATTWHLPKGVSS